MTGASLRFELREALRRGWAQLRAHPLHVLIGVLLATIDIPGSGGIKIDRSRFLDQVHDPTQARWFALGLTTMAIVGSCALLVLFGVRAFGLPGWLRYLRSSLDDAAPDPGALLSGGDVFLRQAGFRVLRTLVVFGPTMVLVVAGISAMKGLEAAGVPGRAAAMVFVATLFAAPFLWAWLAARMLFGDVLVAVDRAGPMAAVRGSWAITRGASVSATGWVLKLALLAVAATVLGVLALGVGLLVTVPLYVVTADLGRLRAWQAYTAAGRPTSG